VKNLASPVVAGGGENCKKILVLVLERTGDGQRRKKMKERTLREERRVMVKVLVESRDGVVEREHPMDQEILYNHHNVSEKIS